MIELTVLRKGIRHLSDAMGVAISIVVFFGMTDLFAGQLISPVVLGNSKEYPLAGHLEYARDPAGRNSFRNVIASPEKIHFQPLEGYLSKGYTRDALWLRFSVKRQNVFPETAMLRIWPAYLDSVTVYLQEGQDPENALAYRAFLLGDHIPITATSVKNPEIVVPLKFHSDKPSMVYIRVKTGSALNLTCSIHTIDDLSLHTSRFIISRAVILGITLAFLILNLIVFFRIRERLYLWYLLYTFFIMLTIFGLSNLYGYFWPSLLPLISDYVIAFGVAGSTISYLFFARLLFGTTKYRWIEGYLRLIITVALSMIVLVPFGYYSLLAQILFAGMLGVIIVMTALSLSAIRQKDPAGWLYFVAFGVANPGYFLQFLRLLGIIPIAWWNCSAFELASMFNLLFIAYALTEKILLMEREQISIARSAEKRALRLAETMTHEIRENKKQLEIAQVSLKNTIDRQHRFMRMMSHEYSTPLAIVVANLDFIQLTAPDVHNTYRKEMESIRKAVDRLVELMDISLKKSRIVSPEENFRFSLFPAIPFFSSLMEEVRSIWPNRRFNYPLNLDFMVIFGDQYYLNKLMLNLIDNACKYSPQDSGIMIDIRKENVHVVLMVVNKINGLIDNDIDILFDEFQRGNASAGAGGAGLGLWLVKEITERHHGRIYFEKNANSVTVSIHLPAEQGIP